MLQRRILPVTGKNSTKSKYTTIRITKDLAQILKVKAAQMGLGFTREDAIRAYIKGERKDDS